LARLRPYRHPGAIASTVAVIALLGFGASATAAGPIESDPAVDSARQGLATYLAAQPAIGASDVEFEVCPVMTESDLVSPLVFFGPVGTFDTSAGEIATDAGSGDFAELIGVTCEIERTVAPQGGVLAAGVAVLDVAGHGDYTSAINTLPVTGDGSSPLGGTMRGYCESSSDDHTCYQFWMLDGFVVGMFVGFEQPDSQKDPLGAVGQILSTQVPTLLANAAALSSAPSDPMP